MHVGRNEQCPCGSGLKYKKCCANKASIGYSHAERTSARTKLLDYVADHLGREDDAALDQFWGPLGDLEDDDLNANPHFTAVSEQIFDDWAVFDHELEGGDLMVDRFLATKASLTTGERNYLGIMKASSLRLYEVEDLTPGDALTLRDLIEGDRVTVQEKAASRSLHRFDWIATRVVASGASGRPELKGLTRTNKRFPEDREPGRAVDAPRRPAGSRELLAIEAFLGARGGLSRDGEVAAHTDGETAKSSAGDGWCPSHREEQLRRGGGGRQDPRRKRDAEFDETGLGLLPGGVKAADGATATARALENVGAEGVLMEVYPIEARPLLLWRGRGNWSRRCGRTGCRGVSVKDHHRLGEAGPALPAREKDLAHATSGEQLEQAIATETLRHRRSSSLLPPPLEVMPVRVPTAPCGVVFKSSCMLKQAVSCVSP